MKLTRETFLALLRKASQPKPELPQMDDRIRFIIPILLDTVAVQLGPWSGYNVLAQNRQGPPCHGVGFGEVRVTGASRYGGVK